MEIARILWRLWHMKFGLLVGLLIAVAAGLLSAYDVRTSPVGLKAKTLDFGAADTKFIVDTPQSALADVDADTGALAVRAEIFSSFIESDRIRRAVARRMDVPERAIEITGKPNAPGPTVAREPTAQERSNDLLAAGVGYHLVFQAQPELPVVNIASTAPTGAEAARLADTAVQALRQELRRFDPPGDATNRRVVIRQPGPAVGSQVVSRANIPMAVIIGTGTLVAWACVLLLLGGLRREWRHVSAVEDASSGFDAPAYAPQRPDDADAKADADADAERDGRELQTTGRRGPG